eukprot:TRINITY_DN13707_c1_g1_i1.p1 TRINITY_DN13707_c1_g1~~TRINITY_DN13707_c1_g1_i1.p1  ORF type:complete len:179 (-),score=6.88 TRINITY_DN13707_c1_g1_i1:172-708(-)
MEISVIPDAISIATTQGLSFAKSLLRNPHSSASYPDPFHGAGTLTISAAALPTDAISPPTVRSKRPPSVPRTLARRLRRTRKRSATDGSDDGDVDGEGDGFFGSGDGPFGGGGGGGSGGGRWNFDRSGDSSPYSDPAFDFVYEVLCWIVLLHCTHFSFKRIGDLFREKVSVRFVPSVC